MELNGKICLITGAASGIGLCCSEELLKLGCKVTLADVNVAAGESEEKRLQGTFGESHVIFMKCDITKDDEFEEIFKRTIEHFGGLDIVVNNAGIFDDANWEFEVDVNVKGPIRGTLLALKYLGKDKGGKGGVVANMASVAGILPSPVIPIYCATKHAVVGLSRSFGSKLHYDRTGVRVVTICPGGTDTPIRDSFSERIVFEYDLEPLIKALGPMQQPVFVAKATVHAIREGENGSVWVSENSKPAGLVQLPRLKVPTVDQ